LSPTGARTISFGRGHLTASKRIHSVRLVNAKTRGSATHHHLTIRGLPAPLARALDAERKRRGVSLNQTVIDLLSRSLGVGNKGARSNGLRALAGTWSADEHARFERATTIAEQLEEELWP
jgi:hypothetical protein